MTAPAIKFEDCVIGTYNVHGINGPTLSYINDIMTTHDFLLIQEHWLQTSQLHLLNDKIKNIHSYGISGMNENELHTGRPYGGCAILWRNSLPCKVEPIQCNNSRLCLAKVSFNTFTLLLCTVYMPCDTEYDNCNNDVFNEVLQEMLKHANDDSIDFVVCGGDFNTDIARTRSLHTKSIINFLDNDAFILCDSLDCSSVDYSYESMSNGSRSTIDHVIVSENMSDFITAVKTTHEIDNISDHAVMTVHFNLSIQHVHTSVQREAQLLWTSATSRDIDLYKFKLDESLASIILDPDVIYCQNHSCTKHHESIVALHDNIISSCLYAGKSIPSKSPSSVTLKPIPGWKEYVEPYRSDALFWHFLWKDNGSPSSGYVADIRRRTGYIYHNVLRKVKRQENYIRSMRMAQNIDERNYTDFWSSIKKINGNRSSFASNIDSAGDIESIGSLFHEKYKNLYNCVSYNDRQMTALKVEIDNLVSDHDLKCFNTSTICTEHNIHVSNIIDSISRLKRGKNDGNRGHFSDHIINGTPKLYIYLSILFHTMLSHGCVPGDFLISTLVPIPKNKRKSLNNSENYRAIALSSILGKLFDNILLVKCNRVFETSDLQYGFKPKHGTTQCTFVVNEVLQYYANNHNNICITLIDSSKAFDRIQYINYLDCYYQKIYVHL